MAYFKIKKITLDSFWSQWKWPTERKWVAFYSKTSSICFVQEPLAGNFAAVMLHACFLFGLSNHFFFYYTKWEWKRRMPHWWWYVYRKMCTLHAISTTFNQNKLLISLRKGILSYYPIILSTNITNNHIKFEIVWPFIMM